MSTEFIVGIVLTIFFGIVSYIQSRKEKPTQLIFVIDDFINLYADITRNIKGIDVTYEGEKVRDNLYLMKGYIFCFGVNDIKREDITKNIQVGFSNNSIWKDCKIINETNGLDVKVFREQSNVSFDIDLLKNDDFFYFDALFELDKKNADLGNLFRISHRIANIGPVKTVNYKNDIMPIFVPILAWLFSAFIAIVLLIPTLTIDDSLPYNYKIHYYYKNHPFNIDSAKTLLVRKATLKVDSINKLVGKATKKANDLKKQVDRFPNSLSEEEYTKYLATNSKLLTAESKRFEYEMKKNELEFSLSRYKSGSVPVTPQQDSAFEKFKKEHKVTYFLLKKQTEPIKLDKNYSVSYSPLSNNDLYISLAVIGMILFLVVGDIVLTNQYWKNKRIISKIDAVRQKTKSS